MLKHNDTSSNSFRSNNKDIRSRVQLQAVHDAFMERPSTMLEVAERTGIMRASVCRYVSKLRQENKIVLIKKGICSISLHRAGFLTTDPNKFPKNSQTAHSV